MPKLQDAAAAKEIEGSQDDIPAFDLSAQDIKDKITRSTIENRPDIIKAIHQCGLLTKDIGEEALRLAAQHNMLDIASVLVLDCQIDVDAYDKSKPLSYSTEETHKTPLGIAIEFGHERIASFFLSQGARVDKYTHTSSFLGDCTPLALAIISENKSSNPKLIETLMQHHASLQNLNELALLSLPKMTNPKAIEHLLDYGLDPKLQFDNKSLLTRCFEENNYIFAAKLIQAGADVFVTDSAGQSYLHKSQDPKLTQLLLEKGLDPELEDKEGRSPILCVDKQSAELLADRGANVTKLSVHSHTVLSSPKLALLLINLGQDFNKVEDGTTPLHRLAKGASRNGYLQVLELILTKANVDPNIATAHGQNALHFAFGENKGLDTDSLNKSNILNSPFTKASDLLLKYGVVPTPDKKGRTPLMCLANQRFSIKWDKELIKRYGATEAIANHADPALYIPQLEILRGITSSIYSGSFFGFGSLKIRAIEDFWSRVIEKPAANDQKIERNTIQC